MAYGTHATEHARVTQTIRKRESFMAPRNKETRVIHGSTKQRNTSHLWLRGITSFMGESAEPRVIHDRARTTPYMGESRKKNNCNAHGPRGTMK